jgi:WD40-like Beta Propeller Repeat
MNRLANCRIPERWCRMPLCNLQPRRILLSLLLALALPGCIPTTWLPDSSGFIYVKPIKGKEPFAPTTGGQLVHYDLQKKAGRVLVADIGRGTMWPALSPDGKRIAVSRFKGEAGQAKTVQIAFYDLAGKLLKESKELAWADAKKQEFSFNSGGMLFWSAKDDMLIITDLERTGLYNLRNDSIKVLDQAMPVTHGGSPILPDGKGVLLVVSEGDIKNKKSRLVVMDWAGAEQKIDTAALDALAMEKKKADEGVGGLAIFSLVFPSWWDGASALAGPKRDKLFYKIDTAKKMLSLSDGFAAMIKSDKEPGKEYPLWFDFASGISVKLDPFQGDAKDGKSKQTYHKILAVNNKTGKEETLAAKAPGMQLFSPSPNGTYLALGLGETFGSGTEPPQILVINNKGELHAKIMMD